MPQLDVSELLSDPDFCDNQIWYTRLAQVVGNDGIAVNSPVRTQFSGVVTSVRGSELDRTPTGERITGSILICTKTRLIAGQSGFTADIVEWNGLKYTVSNVQNYSRYGAGFIEATCDLYNLSG